MKLPIFGFGQRTIGIALGYIPGPARTEPPFQLLAGGFLKSFDNLQHTAVLAGTEIVCENAASGNYFLQGFGMTQAEINHMQGEGIKKKRADML